MDRSVSLLENEIGWQFPITVANRLYLPSCTKHYRASLDLIIPKELYSFLQALSKQHGATLFMTLASAANVLLHRYTNQNDICIGTPTAARNQQATEQLIGYFINTVVLRNEFVPDLSFLDLLTQVNKTTVEAFEHQDIPFEKVVEATTNERDVSRNPLFQVMLVLQNSDAKSKYRLGDATMKRSDQSFLWHLPLRHLKYK